VRDSRIGSKGFTLVELVITMVLVGILAAVGTSRFMSIGGFSERFFLDETLGAIRYAQKLAVVTGCETRVDFSASSFSLEQRANCSSGGFTQPVPHPGNGELTYTGSAPSGIVLVSDVDPLVFDALGRALDGTAASDVLITVGTRAIRVAGETGFAREQ
jgi:MSHA pilin protein MshC